MMGRLMLRGNSRIFGLLLPLACAVLGASSARATLIDDFNGAPALGTYSIAPSAIDFGVILPLATTHELDYLGSRLGMQVEYSLSSYDLTESGSNNRLSLEILGIVPSTGPITLDVSVNGGAPATFLITSIGTLPMPFSSFANESAFASVDELKLTFTSGLSFGLAADDLQAVPEPSTLPLVGMGLLGLV